MRRRNHSEISTSWLCFRSLSARSISGSTASRIFPVSDACLSFGMSIRSMSMNRQQGSDQDQRIIIILNENTFYSKSADLYSSQGTVLAALRVVKASLRVMTELELRSSRSHSFPQFLTHEVQRESRNATQKFTTRSHALRSRLRRLERVLGGCHRIFSFKPLDRVPHLLGAAEI